MILSRFLRLKIVLNLVKKQKGDYDCGRDSAKQETAGEVGYRVLLGDVNEALEIL